SDVRPGADTSARPVPGRSARPGRPDPTPAGTASGHFHGLAQQPRTAGNLAPRTSGRTTGPRPGTGHDRGPRRLRTGPNPTAGHTRLTRATRCVSTHDKYG